MSLPRHPDHNDDETASASGVPVRRTQIIILAGAALIVLVVILHLSGVIGH